MKITFVMRINVNIPTVIKLKGQTFQMEKNLVEIEILLWKQDFILKGRFSFEVGV